MNFDIEKDWIEDKGSVFGLFVNKLFISSLLYVDLVSFIIVIRDL